MSKKNDDSIERIFRKALTQHEPTFVEGDWLKMEKMLDEEASRRAAIRSKRIKGTTFALMGLMGLIVAVYFLAFNNPSDSVERFSPLSPELRAEEDQRNIGNVENESSSSGLLSSEKDSAQTEILSEASVLKQKEVVPPRKEDQGKKYLSDKKSNSSTELSNPASPKKYKTAKPHRALTNNEDESADRSPAGVRTDRLQSDAGVNFKNDKGTYDTNSIASQRSAKNGNVSDTVKQPSSPLATSSEAIDSQNLSPVGNERSPGNNPTDDRSATIHPDSAWLTLPGNRNAVIDQGLSNSDLKQQDTVTVAAVIKHAKVIDDTDSLQETQQRHKVKPSSRWSLGLLFAPEFSTTRLNHYSTPGESLGLRIGYQVSNRFAVNTGIIRSTKKYKDDAGEYNTNPNYWRNRTNGVIPEEIKGKCLVLEIPLDLQFDVLQTQKSRVFASAGISSYLMLSQSYSYNFDVPNRWADSGWSTSESESYWFGVGIMSAGYERNIHPALMIGIEPYLKMALTEVGWPNIKLLSTGAYVTLRYKFIGK